MLHRIVNSHWFALTDLFLVMAGGVAWMLKPGIGLWSILIALIAWAVRLSAGKFPFQRTRFDAQLFVFLITAWVGFWAAYDKSSAWEKVWLIVLAVLFYYALASQPEQNLIWVSFLSFGIGVGVSMYFFLTHDFIDSSGGLASWWMSTRPRFGWQAIHHGYISGIVVITALFSSYGFWWMKKRLSTGIQVLLTLLTLPVLGIVGGAFVFTLSRGIWLAIGGAFGVWLLWKVLSSIGSVAASLKWSFPLAVLISLCVLVAIAYIGPARFGESVTQSEYGRNTRSELFLRASYFLEDYPIIGGGLNSFPGLYSNYLLVIPHYYFINSYNLFLDVGIEQGLIGGMLFLGIYLGSVWFGSQGLAKSQTAETRLLNWLSLFAIVVTIVHGMLYDYLYNGVGTFLMFLPAGISTNSMLHSLDEERLPDSPVTPKERNTRIRSLLLATVGLVILALMMNIGKVQSIWYANLGAVQMAQVELRDFPTGQWMDPENVPGLEAAEKSHLTSLRFDPANRTANHRLGLIYLLRAEFESAALHLETAYERAPQHRGVIKSLGYCYVWLGDFEKAQRLLSDIPEASEELGVYVWWWGERGRYDLSENASKMISLLEITTVQP